MPRIFPILAWNGMLVDEFVVAAGAELLRAMANAPTAKATTTSRRMRCLLAEGRLGVLGRAVNEPAPARITSA